MKDIELRFVERDEREQVDTYFAMVRKRQVLQYRKLIPPSWNADYDKWTEWQDVPLGVEEK